MPFFQTKFLARGYFKPAYRRTLSFDLAVQGTERPIGSESVSNADVFSFHFQQSAFQTADPLKGFLANRPNDFLKLAIFSQSVDRVVNGRQLVRILVQIEFCLSEEDIMVFGGNNKNFSEKSQC